MTIADNPKWLATAVMFECGTFCRYPECADHKNVQCAARKYRAGAFLRSITPLIDAAIAEAVGREREAAISLLYTVGTI